MADGYAQTQRYEFMNLQEINNYIRGLQCQGCFHWGNCQLTQVIDTYPAQYDYECSVCKTRGTMSEPSGSKQPPNNPVDTWGRKP